MNLKKLLKDKAGVFSELGSLGIGVASLAIVLTVTFLIMAQAKVQIVGIEGINVSDPSTYTAGFNATNTLVDAVATVPTFVPIIIIAAIGGILLGLVAVFRTR